MKIQNFLISLAVPFARMTGRLSSQCRYIIGVICMFLTFGVFLFMASGLVPYRYLYPYVLSCILLGIATIISVPLSLHHVRWKRSYAILWFAVGIFILQAAFRLNTDYFTDALMFMVLLPMWFFFWNNCGDLALFRLLSWGCISSFVFVIVANILFFPATGGPQYTGILSNSMDAGEYFALVFPCLLVEIFRSRSLCRRYIFLLVLIGICASLSFYCGNRSGLLAIILSFLCTSILYLINNWSEWKLRLLVNILPVLISVAIFIPSSLYFFQLRTIVLDLLPEPTQASQAGSELDSKNPGSELDSKNPGSEVAPPASINTIAKWNRDRLFSENKTKDLDGFFSGRISFWKGFLQNLNLLGHDFSKPFAYYNEGLGEMALSRTAHMTHLEFAYRYGVPCSLLFLIYNFLAGFGSIRYAIQRHKEGDYVLFPIAVTLSFGAVCLFISIGPGVKHMIGLYYGLIQAPLITVARPESFNT